MEESEESQYTRQPNIHIFSATGTGGTNTYLINDPERKLTTYRDVEQSISNVSIASNNTSVTPLPSIATVPTTGIPTSQVQQLSNKKEFDLQTSKETNSAECIRSSPYHPEHLQNMHLPKINLPSQSSIITSQVPSSISSPLSFGANSGPISIMNVENTHNSNLATTAGKFSGNATVR
jgi:hypothetical protein